MKHDLPPNTSFDLLDFLPLGVFVLNSELTILFWNTCLEEWTHISRHEIVGQPIDSYFPHLLQPNYLNRLNQVFEGGHPIVFSSQLHPHLISIERLDGQLQVQHTTVTARPSDQPGEFYALWSIQDVTDLSNQVNRYKAEQMNVRRSEAALAQELLRTKALFNTSLDGIVVMDQEGNVVQASPSFSRMLGYTVEETRTLNIADWDAQFTRQDLQRMWEGLNTPPRFETCHRRKDGSLYDVEVSYTRLQLEGEVMHFCICRDISDRKQKEIVLRQTMEAAEAANLAKSMFLANMSHELRTPLNVILGFAQVMGHDRSLTPSQQQDLQTIRRSGDHLLRLINDVLDLSKIEAGHYGLEEAGFDLISLLYTLRTMMAERANAKRLHLTFDIASDIPQFLIADEQKLRQVLLNLLSNAIKFTHQGGVTLRATRQDWPDNSALTPAEGSACLLKFEVMDTGVGMITKDQETIFDAFVQAEAGRKAMSGTGLGLTISRKLVELMQGTITVHSVPEVGSTFTVTVPVCPISGVAIQFVQPERTVIGLVPGYPSHRILVVDDQLENRLLMVRLLAQLNLEVREAHSGQEAIHQWQTWHPDLIWMDIRMPDMDGYEATRQIRAMEQAKATIIIALTAQASQSDRTLALAAGCNDYISKPFQEATVFLKLSEHLGLQYLYADSSPDPTPFPAEPTLAANAAPRQSELTTLPWPELATLPSAWFRALEDAAACGNDHTVVTLANQLTPEFAALTAYLIDLADRFQFEQILNLLHQQPPQSS